MPQTIFVEKIDTVKNELTLRNGTKSAFFKMSRIPKDILTLVGKIIELSDHAMYHGMEMIAWCETPKHGPQTLDFMVDSIKDVFDE